MYSKLFFLAKKTRKGLAGCELIFDPIFLCLYFVKDLHFVGGRVGAFLLYF